MKLRIEPITLTVLAILMGWGWMEIVDEPVCQVQEVHDGVTILVPHLCKDVLPEN